MSNYHLDRDTELALKQSHSDFYRMLREFAVDERPYHETLDREKFKREADTGLLNCEDFFNKKQIKDAYETFENEKSIKTTLRKTASVGSTEQAETNYYYVSSDGGVYEDDREEYLKNVEDGFYQLIHGNNIFCYASFLSSKEVEEYIKEYKGEDYFNKKQIKDAFETFNSERTIKSARTTLIAPKYFYMSVHNPQMQLKDLDFYTKLLSDECRVVNQIVAGENMVFLYSEGFVSDEEANRRVDEFLELKG